MTYTVKWEVRKMILKVIHCLQIRTATSNTTKKHKVQQTEHPTQLANTANKHNQQLSGMQMGLHNEAAKSGN